MPGSAGTGPLVEGPLRVKVDHMELVAVGADLGGRAAAEVHVGRADLVTEHRAAKIPVAPSMAPQPAIFVPPAVMEDGPPWGVVVVVAAKRLADKLGPHRFLAHPGMFGARRSGKQSGEQEHRSQQRVSELHRPDLPIATT